MRPPEKHSLLVPADIESATELWLRNRGISLRPISNRERMAALQRLAQHGDPARRRALRLVALWSLAPKAQSRSEHLSVRDMADFIEAEGFALIDAWGERTLTSEETDI
ncbi:MAG: hypothetical protein AAGC62_03110 [Pseudomonadota bacterium]